RSSHHDVCSVGTVDGVGSPQPDQVVGSGVPGQGVVQRRADGPLHGLEGVGAPSSGGRAGPCSGAGDGDPGGDVDVAHRVGAVSSQDQVVASLTPEDVVSSQTAHDVVA